MDYSGKVAMVTGGSKGIGRGLAVDLAQRGAHVVIAARTPANVHEVVDEILRSGGSAEGLELDVGNPGQVQEAFAGIGERHGRLDLLFTCAAISAWGRVEDLDPRRLEEVIRVNLLGTAWCVQAVLPIMRKQAGGTVVAFTSHSAALPLDHAAAYSASKAGIVAFMEAVYTEVCQSGINIHIVYPAVVPDTDLAAADIAHRGSPPSLAIRSVSDVSSAVLAAIGGRHVHIYLPRGSGVLHVARAAAPSLSLRLLARQAHD